MIFFDVLHVLAVKLQMQQNGHPLFRP